jgi:phospholipase C
VCGDLTSAFDFTQANDSFPSLPSTAADKPTGQSMPTYTPTPPPVGSVPTQEPGVRPSRRLGYRFDVAFAANPGALSLGVANRGILGVHLQARSLTIPGAPYSYTIGAGDELRTTLPNPGAYDLSLHGPNGFYRHFAGSPGTDITVEALPGLGDGRLRLRIASGSGQGRNSSRSRVHLADAYGGERDIELRGAQVIAIDTGASGGWYDVTLTTPSDPSFTVTLAGRMESARRLTSDPQLGRAAG